MFVNIVHFPPIKAGQDQEFRDWFAWSNDLYKSHPGFISRRLLKPREGGNYAAIVEHDSFETFWAMHTSSDQAKAGERIKPLLEGTPTPVFYEVIVG